MPSPGLRVRVKLDFDHSLVSDDIPKFEELFLADIAEATGMETGRMKLVSVEPSVIEGSTLVTFDIINEGFQEARFKEVLFAEDAVEALEEQIQHSDSKLRGGTYTAYINVAFGIRVSAIPTGKGSGEETVGTASSWDDGIDMVLPINDRFIELESKPVPSAVNSRIANRLRRFLGLRL